MYKNKSKTYVLLYYLIKGSTSCIHEKITLQRINGKIFSKEPSETCCFPLQHTRMFVKKYKAL
jgi:hypothetical protein